MQAAASPVELNAQKSVVVLMPPPVPPGEAPINISAIITRRAALGNAPRLWVANPAVLADTLLKSDSSQVKSPVSFSKSVPARINPKLMKSATFV